MNTLRVHLDAARSEFHQLQSLEVRKRAEVGGLRSSLVGSAVTDFESSSGVSVATSFVTSRDASRVMSELVNRTVEQNSLTGLLDTLRSQQQELSDQQQQANRQLQAIANSRAALARRQKQLDSRTTAVQHVLSRLKARQRQRLARRQARQDSLATSQVSRSTSRVGSGGGSAGSVGSAASGGSTASVASGSASVAVAYALAQVGDPYVYGAAGPDAFDCSGLTMAAWSAAGVSLPHSASMQASAGTPVSLSSLMPGDLVFYYSPISHVGLYVGNGQVVHAPYPGSVVQVAPVNSMPVAMAVRIG